MARAKQVEPRTEVEADVVQRHLRFGWWSMLVFLTLGIVLEVLHGFKIDWYLNVANETRRFMWTLAHAHGTLVALINIAFAATAQRSDLRKQLNGSWISPCLIGAGIALPGGFFLGGLFIYAGDPGLGILLVPVGAIMLLFAVLMVALRIR